MASVNKQYVREMNEKFGYLATWLPNVRLKLGDVGIIRDYAFEPVSLLDKFGIKFTSDIDQQPVDLEYTSSDGVSIETTASGAAPSLAAGAASADGNIRISFKRANAVVFQASGCVTSKIADIRLLGNQVLSRYDQSLWDPDHVVITDLITSDGATILISNGQDAHIDLALKAQVGSNLAKLADANANVSVTRASGIGTRIIAAKGLTPLFKVAGVRRRLLRGPDFTRRQAGEAQFVELDYKDLG